MEMHAKALFEMKQISDLQISKDGNFAVFVVAETSLKEDKKFTNIWVKDLNCAGEPRQLTQSGKDSNPRFCPDGTSIIFTSQRGEKAKSAFYKINIKGGEAKELGLNKVPLGAPVLSANGQKLAFLSLVKVSESPRYPGEAEELYKWDGEEEKKDAPIVISDIHYRADGRGYIHKEYAQVFVYDFNEKEEPKQLTEGKERINQIAFSPDGNYLYYMVNLYNLEKGVNQTAIKRITLAGNLNNEVLIFDGQARQILVADGGASLLIVAADNSYPGGVSTARLWHAPLNKSLPLKEEDIICLNPLEDGVIGNLLYLEEKDQLFYTKAYEGNSNLYLLPYANGLAEDEESVLPLTCGVVNSAEIADNGTIVLLKEDATNPVEIFSWQKGELNKLSSFNKEFVEKYPPLKVERFTYKGADNWDVDGFLILPKGYEKGQKVPTVLSIHGGPTGVYMDNYQFPFQFFANNGYAVVYTNPRGSITYGAEFANGCVNDLGGKDFQDIMLGLDYVIDKGVADPNQLFVTGWSYGGFMTSWTITQTDRFKAAVAGAIISNWMTLGLVCDIPQYGEGLIGGPMFDKLDMALARSPIAHARNVVTPTMFIHGEADVRCPQDQTEQLYYALKRLEKETVFVRYPGQYHGIMKPSYVADRWQRTLNWFNQHLN